MTATDHYDEAGPQDIVILAMKAHQVEAVANDVPKLFGPDTVGGDDAERHPLLVLPQARRARSKAARCAASTRNGVVGARIPAERVIGCVVYPASELVAPGVVKHIEGDRFPGRRARRLVQRARATGCRTASTRAGFKAPVLDNIRAEIWLKLWGNLTFNPISSLSHSTLVDICQYPPSRELAAAMMREAQAVAHKLGIEFRVSLEKRIAGAEKVGKHKTSMLQDVEAGRAPGDRCAGGRGGRTGAADRHADAAHRHRLLRWSSCWPGRWRISAARSGFTRWLEVAGKGGDARVDEERDAAPVEGLRSGRAAAELLARRRGASPDAARRLDAGEQARGARGQCAVRAVRQEDLPDARPAPSCCRSAAPSSSSSRRPRTR